MRKIPLRLFLAALAPLLMSPLSQPPKNGDEGPALTETDKLAKHERDCAVVKEAWKTVRIPRMPMDKVEDRVEILRDIELMLACVPPNPQYDPSLVCVALDQYINAHPTGWFPKWGKNSSMKPFLVLLRDELECQGVMNPNSSAPISVRDLYSTLNIKIKRDPPKVLDPRVPIAELCRPMFELAEKHEKEIQTISRYVLSGKDMPPPLAKRIASWKADHQKKHGKDTLPTEKEMQVVVEENVAGMVESAGSAWWKCGLGSFFTNFVGKERIAKWERSRTEMFIALRELVHMLAKDQSREGKEALS